MDNTKPANAFVSYWFYPLLLVAVLTLFTTAYRLGWDLKTVSGYYLGTLITLLVLIETLYPLEKRWRMTRDSFLRRDLPYLVIGGTAIGGANYLASWLALELGLSMGDAHRDMPIVPAVIFGILLSDFLWYWVHRLSHEWRGPIGDFLWRTHVAHHLPQQVYVFMHGVGHPLNTVVARGLFTLPLFFLGLPPEAPFFVTTFVGLQGMVSHFNVDIRAGWLNYVLMGTELHRYHHSADPKESKNYASAVVIWDLLFGTFYYRPGVAPAELGVQQPEHYPDARQVWQVMKLPFRPGAVPGPDRVAYDEQG